MTVILQLHTRLTKVLSELQEEKQMNKCLLENQQVWQKKVQNLESQVKDLTITKEQVSSGIKLLHLYQILCKKYDSIDFYSQCQYYYYFR